MITTVRIYVVGVRAGGPLPVRIEGFTVQSFLSLPALPKRVFLSTSNTILGLSLHESAQISCSSGEIFKIPSRTPKNAKNSPFSNFRGGGGGSRVLEKKFFGRFRQRYIQN